MSDKQILKRAYIDYKQLERILYIDFGKTKDLQAVYNYIECMSEHKENKISFTNIYLEDGFFDFNYKDMLLTISNFNVNDWVWLAESIEVYDENGILIKQIDFEDLEKEVLGYNE